MKVLITGGTGLIGSALAADLATDGHSVVVLTRSPDRSGSTVSGVMRAGWDGRTAAGWLQHAEGADAVVNLAGASIGTHRWTAARKRLIVDSRVHAGEAVVDAWQQASVPPKILVQQSAVGYYGAHGDEILDEDAAKGGDFLADVCQRWESATEAVELLGGRRAVIRTGLVLAPNAIAYRLLSFPFRVFAGGRVGSGRQWTSWIHIADLIGAIRHLLASSDARGVYNLTAPGPVTNAKLARELGAVLRRPVWLPVPAAALRLALGEMATVLLDGQRVLPRRLVEMGYPFRYTAVGAALAVIEHPPPVHRTVVGD